MIPRQRQYGVGRHCNNVTQLAVSILRRLL
jgi:hypothetical protein